MSSLWSYPEPRYHEHLDELNLSGTPRQVAPVTRPVAVMVDGPSPAQDAYGDEYPEWTVSLVDSEGDDTGKSYTCRSFRSAINLGTQIADDRHLELVNEAMQA
jgi:hypothetical protein